MAEIEETPNDAPDSSGNNESETKQEISDFDPSAMRKTKPGLKRLALSLSVLFSFLLGSLSLSLSTYICIHTCTCLVIVTHAIFAILLILLTGLPFLLKSIEIYRAPLPFSDIDSLSGSIESALLAFPCRFHAVLVGFDRGKTSDEWTVDELGNSILGQMNKFTGDDRVCGSCGRNNYSVLVTVDSNTDCVSSRCLGFGLESACSWRCGATSDLKLDDDDEVVDEYLESALRGSEGCGYGGKVYTVVVVKRDEEVRAVVGKHRHAWIVGRVSEVDAVEKVAEIFIRVFVNGGKEGGVIPGEFMPVGADGKIVLSFNLLNADPDDWVYDWYVAVLSLHRLSGAA